MLALKADVYCNALFILEDTFLNPFVSSKYLSAKLNLLKPL